MFASTKLLWTLSTLSGILLTATSRKLEGFFQHGIECTPCADTTGTCQVNVKVNLYASETGHFEIEGCEGINPTLYLTVGRTYLFEQSDITNWYHLMGFAYEADGAHVPVDELEPGIAPGGSSCNETLSCPAPMYIMNNVYQGTYSNNADIAPINGTEDFGLDVVEPLFFHPLADWQSYGTFVAALNFDIEFDQDIFYFCHVHAGMSARIKFLDADGNKLNEDNTPELPYDYAVIEEFDAECGTFNLTGWTLENQEQCPEFFLCGETTLSTFATCVEAMNCHMMSSMTTMAVGKSELFCHQMIPHHQNAVNMAKSLLFNSGLQCDNIVAEEGSDAPFECELVPILYDIINNQNSQIIDMQTALEQLGAAEYANCDVDFSDLKASSRRSLAEEEAGDVGSFVSGVDCKPCEDTSGTCEVVMGVNLYAGQMGYFTVEGCEGVNPTLHLTVGRTYLFKQDDISNWYHLLGFAYFPDGAHVGVDELEPGLPADNSCAESLSCPAPMYWMDGVYQGVYSNAPELVDIPTTPSDDFGLDAVEPLFFHPVGDWETYGTFFVTLNFDFEYDQDIFYFCHLHSGMTGRIKLLDADGNLLNEENTPAIPYEYDSVSEYDSSCGSFDIERFKLPNDQCPSQFVCNDASDDLGEFADCIDSMNCAMLDGMTTNYGSDELVNGGTHDVILFIRQMIPHHQNAINMAKVLLLSGEVDCTSVPAEEGDHVPTACLLEPIVRSIINTQNYQIQVMQGILETFEVAEFSDCDYEGSGAAAQASKIVAMLAALAAFFV